MYGCGPGSHIEQYLAQIGEGRIFGLFTFFGMICGTYIYALLREKYSEL